jgi:ParB family chromosome partitioning protein
LADSQRSRAVLGKGLGALIPKAPPSEPINPQELSRDAGGENVIVAIDVSRVRSNPYQPRLDFNPLAMEELKKSIVEKGVIQPITVRRIPGGLYELVSGERRIRACHEAGVATIPAYIIKVDSDEEMLELALIENLQREHLNPIEVAISYQRLIDECRFTQEEVAQKIGKDRTTVTNFIRLLKLPEKVQHSLRMDEISMGHARSLLSVTDEKTLLRLHGRIVKQGLSVRKVEELVREIAKPEIKRTKSRRTGSSDSHLQHLETTLRHALSTKVTIHQTSAEAGEIVIEYYSPDDLERILEMLQKASG